MTKNYKNTIFACFVGYIVQAIVVIFVPMLFITFKEQYGIPLSKITLLITFNFVLQLLVDFASAFFVDKIGYRAAALLAHIFSASGLILLTILPEVLPDPFYGMAVSVMLYAIGGGLLEVIINPIVESCPTEHKDKTISMLHSFYSWGCVGVICISTLLFKLFGIENWKSIVLLWAIIPVINGVVFLKVPIAPPSVDACGGLSFTQLMKDKSFWLFILIMCCAGASEQAVAQWVSAYAEKGLNISKSLGDLAGAMSFAAFMGLSRMFYGKFGDRINLDSFMILSTAVCVVSYIFIAAAPLPILGLIGCSVCGLSVGILWPGTISKAAAGIKNGGTAMFAILALAGDLGCSAGPTLAGFVSGHFGDDLRPGILSAIVFPIILLICLVIKRLRRAV